MATSRKTETLVNTNIIIDEASLALNWTLSSDEIQFILNESQGESPILYFASQLKTLANTGDFLHTDNLLPGNVIEYLSKQLNLNTNKLIPVSKNTQTAYHEKIRLYCHYRYYDKKDALVLKNFIEEKIKTFLLPMEELRNEVCLWLKQNKIIKPSTSQLNRDMASFRKQAIAILYEEIANKLNTKQKVAIDKLLKSKEDPLSAMSHYKKSPPEPTSEIMNIFIERFNTVKNMGLLELDFTSYTKEVFNELVSLGKCYDTASFNSMNDKHKKYSLLTCVLLSTASQLLDYILEMNNNLLGKKERIATNKFNKVLKQATRTAKKGLRTLIKTTRELLHHENKETVTLLDFQNEVGETKLIEAVTACEQVSEYQEKGFYQILENKYIDLRKYTVNFCKLDFEGAVGTKSILQALNILRQLNRENSNKLPDDAPLDFIPKTWQKAMKVNNKTTRRTWEMALYYELKKQINSGDIYLSRSYKHQYFWDKIYKKEAWEKQAQQAFKKLGFPEKFEDMLVILKKEYYEGIELAKNNLNKESFAYINQQGELKLRKEDALIIPPSVKALKALIQKNMPIVRIEKVLADLDREYHFSPLFIPPEGFIERGFPNHQALHAVLVAHGTNLGMVNMANSTVGISLETMKHISQWRLRHETLHNINQLFVKIHSEHPLSQIYGDLSWSGSDGDRFCIQKSSNLASFYPKAFGYYQKVISIYTHLSDQYSVFSTQVISCGVREAAYVLDGLLQNTSVLNPRFHCTDTGGFTHHLFALCYLLGFSFQPRLKDLAEQKLYKIDKAENYGDIDSLFTGTIDMQCIAEQWEQLIRIAASLKDHVAPAHLILQQLTNRAASDRVAKALLELGKLIKTIYILHYISKPELRRKVHLQLNRGESRHYLARHLFFANQGEFKTSDYEEIMNIASCLSLLSNAVLLWNTPRIYTIITKLREDGEEILDKDLAKISPLLFKHLVVNGTYNFINV